ncbi:pilin [Patescibacteria group bacterium]|nr:pilin [Patescibacteria group bacterium]
MSSFIKTNLSVAGILGFIFASFVFFTNQVNAESCADIGGALCQPGTACPSGSLPAFPLTPCGSGEICCIQTVQQNTCSSSCVPANQCQTQGSGTCVSPAGTVCCDQIIQTQSGGNDCQDACVAADQCQTIGKNIAGNAEGTCTNPAGSVCCAVVKEPEIVTPEGYASGTVDTGVAGTGGAATQLPKSTAADMCIEPRSGTLFPCPLGQGASITDIIARIISWTLGIVGALFLLMFIWGGMLYIMAGESSDNAAKGRKTLVNAVIGIIIIVFSYIFLNWILTTIGQTGV